MVPCMESHGRLMNLDPGSRTICVISEGFLLIIVLFRGNTKIEKGKKVHLKAFRFFEKVVKRFPRYSKLIDF